MLTNSAAMILYIIYRRLLNECKLCFLTTLYYVLGTVRSIFVRGIKFFYNSINNIMRNEKAGFVPSSL